MSNVICLGVDPGFASLGLAAVQLFRNAKPLVIRVAVVRTEKAAKKRAILSSDDNVDRARTLARTFRNWTRVERPYGGPNDDNTARVRVIGAESMSYARNASAAHKVGICWGVIVAVADAEGLPIAQTSPQDVKKRAAGAKTASKMDVQLAVSAACDFLPEPAEVLRDMALGQREHAYDAIASALAVIDGDLVRGLLR